MDILFFCPRWGSDSIGWETFLDAVVDAGYHGVEIGLPDHDEEAKYVLAAIKQRNLRYILQHYETISSNFDDHRIEYRKRITRLASYQPYLINSHTGRDFFTIEQNMLLLQDAKTIAEINGVTIAHETHRSRFNFACHVTSSYLSNRWLKLTWDVSHWFCVAETLLEDQELAIENAIKHMAHIHARFGHTQGPQIDEFSHEKWDSVKERHLLLWDKVINHHLQHNTKQIGITTEFGPWPYMVDHTPQQNGHVTQFAWNVAMLELLKTRYKNLK